MGIEFKKSIINLVGIVNDFHYNFFYERKKFVYVWIKKYYININADGRSHNNLVKFQ